MKASLLSKLELLSTEENAQALGQGWLVSYVYDGSAWRVMVLSANPAIKHAEMATQIVIANAQRNSPLHIKALRLVVASNQGAKHG